VRTQFHILLLCVNHLTTEASSAQNCAQDKPHAQFLRPIKHRYRQENSGDFHVFSDSPGESVDKREKQETARSTGAKPHRDMR